jgi:hypothetical protein
VRFRTALSKNAACAPAASTAASATTMSAINQRTEGGRLTTDNRTSPYSVVCHPSSQPDEPSNLPRTFGELAERQGIAVLTRRDRKVGQVRLLHSPPLCFPRRSNLSGTNPPAVRASSPMAEAAASNPAQWAFKSPLAHQTDCSVRQAAKGIGPTHRHSGVQILDGAPPFAREPEKRRRRPITV